MRSSISVIAAVVAVAALLPVASAESGLVGACKAKNYTVVDIDVEKYVGRWYEVSRSKSFFFDNGCYCTQAAVRRAGGSCAAWGGVRAGRLVAHSFDPPVLGQLGRHAQGGELVPQELGHRQGDEVRGDGLDPGPEGAR